MTWREQPKPAGKGILQRAGDVSREDIDRFIDSVEKEGELSPEERTNLEAYIRLLEDQDSEKDDHRQTKGSSSDMTKICRYEYAILRVAGLKRFIKMRYPNNCWSATLNIAELFPTEFEEVEAMLPDPEDHNLHNPPTKGDIYTAFKILVEKEARIYEDHNCNCWQAWYCCNKNTGRLINNVRIYI